MTQEEWLASKDPQAMLAWLTARPQQAASTDRKRVSDRKLELLADALACTSCRSVMTGWPGKQSAEWCARYVITADCGSPSVKADAIRDIAGDPFRPVTLPQRCERCGSNNDGMFDDGITCRCSGRVRCPWITPQVLTLAQAAYEERGSKCVKCYGKGGWWHCPGCGGEWAGDVGPDCFVCGAPYLTRKKCTLCKNGVIDDGTLDPFRLALLADALEEAGCGDQALLAHLRGVEYYPAMSGGEIQAWVEVPLRSPHWRGCHAIDAVLGLS